MGKLRIFISGLLVGAIIMTAAPVFAENDLVTVMVDKTISMFIAGEQKTLPSDYAILNYNGYTYLPSRYVAEQLGGTVSWDASSRTIRISAPPPTEVEKIVEVPVEVEKVVYVERDEGYRSLPSSASKGNISITVDAIENLSSIGVIPATWVYADIKNATDYPAMVDYSSVVLTVDGKSYKTYEQPEQDYEKGFAGEEVRIGKTRGGHFSFLQVDTGTHNFILTVPITNQETGEKTVLQAKFSATLKNDK